MFNRSRQPPFLIYPFNKSEISLLMGLFYPEAAMLYTLMIATPLPGTDAKSVAISAVDLSVS